MKHTIEPNTPYDWTPSEEQIETVLLSLEKIPSSLYTTPSQRTWVGLTAKEYVELAQEYGPFPINQIEAKLRSKNEH